MSRTAEEIHQYVGEQCSLAQTYFEDGAPFSAANCLRDAAEALDQGGRDRNEALGSCPGHAARPGNSKLCRYCNASASDEQPEPYDNEDSMGAALASSPRTAVPFE